MSPERVKHCSHTRGERYTWPNRLFGAMLTLMSASMPCAASAIYTYDASGRVAAIFSDDGSCTAYSYDAAGNLAAVTNVASTSGTPLWGTATWGCGQWQANSETPGRGRTYAQSTQTLSR